MENLKTSNRQIQLGKCGEYLAKIAFIQHDFEVYSSDVDDRGIDLVVRKNKRSRFFEVQVKTVSKWEGVFMQKDVFSPKDDLYLLLIVVEDNSSPIIALIPSLEWDAQKKSHSFFVYRSYEGKKSKPEYAINFSKESIATIKSNFAFDSRVQELISVENSVGQSENGS